MMTTSSPISSGQAARYYRHYKAENVKGYYVDGEVDGEWFGEAAKKLGLAGDVSSTDFKRVLDGRHPKTNAQLVRGSSAKDGKRVAGWDVTFAAPKSVSIAALIGRDDRIVAAHDKAVRSALSAIERLARGRVAGRRRGDQTANIAAALFRHATSRDLDPHLHTHSVVVNLTANDEGRWVALDSTALFELQRYGTTLYRNALAHELLSLGYALRHGPNGQIEIDGVTDEHVAHFSKRHAAIWAALRAEGRDDPDAQMRVQRSSRRKKQHVARDVLDRSWRQAASEIGLDLANLRPAPEQTRSVHDNATVEARAREAISFAIVHVTERDAVTTRAKIVEAALSRRLGYVDRDSAVAELDRRIARHEVVPHRDAGEIVTTREMLVLERALLAHLARARNTVRPIATTPSLAGFTLTATQLATARAVLESRDRLVAIAGVAGAGKTYTLRAIASAAESAGLRVRGFAPTTGATEELAKSGVVAKTVAAHLASPGAAPDRELWIVDEASLLSTRQMHRLLEHAQAARARVLFVGDVRQHAGVEAGSPFAMLLAAGLARADLSEILRQRENRALLEAVTAASQGDTATAVRTLDRMEAVTEIPEWDERHDEIAKRYVESPAGTLVIAPSNVERDDLNRLIRDRLFRAGRIAGDGVSVPTLRAVDLSRAERTVAAKYEPGQVVRYRTGSRTYRIAKDSHGVVTERDVARNRLTVRLPNGETRTYDPRRLKGVDVFRTEARMLSTGDRIQFKAPIRRPRISNGALGEIVSIAPDGAALVRLDDRKDPVPLNLRDTRHLDYGYAVTSYSSQGKTVDRALIAIRTRHVRTLVNSAQVYVSISRARREVEVFTDSRQALPRAASREAPKHSASTFSPDLGF